MRKKTKQAASSPKHPTEQPPAEKEFVYCLPPGTKFDDVYMDALQIQQELKYCPRSIRNMREEGLLSYTIFHKRIYYLRQEIAGILVANTVMRREKVA
jgi:hypothetical protein